MRTTFHHLAKRGTAGTWYVVLAVPKDLQSRFDGKHHLLTSLKTTDRAVALARRGPALDDLERKIREARNPAKVANIMEAAKVLNQARLEIQPGDSKGAWVWQDGVDQAADEAAGRYGQAVAQAFLGVATGTATPLQANVDAWLAEPGAKGRLNERTKDQRRAVMQRFEAWMIQAGHPATVEAVTKAVAGAYITDTFITPAAHAITANSKISVLSSYWRWLQKRTGTSVNPWSGQSFHKPPKRTNGDRTKRPLTHDEMVALLSGKPDQEVADAIRLAALSGMRLEELYRLRVAHCTGGIFDIRQAKTDAGVRKVPIHPDLAPIVERRANNKKPTDYLMHEGSNADGRERSAPASQRFGRYRQKVGVHDREDGQRHSRVDFHSLRRWFITESRKGFDRAVVAAVVGHENGNITDVYSAGPDMETKRRCVEFVKLPVQIPPRGLQHTVSPAEVSRRPDTTAPAVSSGAVPPLGTCQ
jgi:integrase